MKRFILSVFVVCSLSMALSAQTARKVEPVVPPSSSGTSAGGLHVAQPGSFQAFYSNPAGFASKRAHWGILDLTLNMSGPVIDIINQVPALAQGNVDIAGLLNALMDENGRLYSAIDLGGPLAFGYVGNGLGFGLFNRSNVIVNVSSPLSAILTVREEFIMAGGYAKTFEFAGNQAIELGVMPKAFVRTELNATTSLLAIVAMAQNPMALLDTMPLNMTLGAGFDIGLTWRYADILALSLVGRDAFSPAMVSTYASINSLLTGGAASPGQAGLVPTNLMAGVYYAVKADFLRRLGVQWDWMVDYRDILDLFAPLPRHPLLNLGIGTRITLLEILQIGLGINETLPTAGFSLKLGLATLAVSMYGRELGMDPGKRPVYNLLISLNVTY